MVFDTGNMVVCTIYSVCSSLPICPHVNLHTSLFRVDAQHCVVRSTIRHGSGGGHCQFHCLSLFDQKSHTSIHIVIIV